MDVQAPYTLATNFVNIVQGASGLSPRRQVIGVFSSPLGS